MLNLCKQNKRKRIGGNKLQILSESEFTHWMYTTGYYYDLQFIGKMLAILFIIGLLVTVFSLSTNHDGFIITSIIITLLSIIVCGVIVLISPQDKPHTEVKATVSDWNQVYEEGWEVIDQEGEIVTLRKYHEEEVE